MSRNVCLVYILLALLFCAADWPQWRGPNRTDISTETGLLNEWPAGGPKKLWSSDKAGLGYAGMSVVGDTLYTMGARDDGEYLIALNVMDGKEKWAIRMGNKLENGWGGGPRGTPTVDDQLVFGMSGRGDLVAAQSADGKLLWQASMTEAGGSIPNWGYTESVLVDGEQLVCTPGGSKGTLMALKKTTGELIWQSSDVTDKAQYSSIIVAEHFGQRQYIQLTMSSLLGIDAASGKRLWSSDWPGNTAVIPTPIYVNGKVYATSGYGVGCRLLEVEANNQVREVYHNQLMKNHHGGVVLIDDHVYGYSDGVGWLCHNLETGTMVWSEKSKLGKGCLTAADGKLYLLEENTGKVVLVDATQGGWHQRGSFVLSPQSTHRSSRGKIWTHPSIAHGRLYLRDQEFITCYDIRSGS